MTTRLPEIYQHYKGDFYAYIAEAINTVDDTPVVIYAPVIQSTPEEPVMFTRPKTEFFEKVEGGQERFRQLPPDEVMEYLQNLATQLNSENCSCEDQEGSDNKRCCS